MSINVEELIRILSDETILGKVKLTAKNKEYLFDSLEDIKANRQLFVGRPKIDLVFEEYANFKVEFNEGATIKAVTLKNDEQFSKLTKLGEQLNTYRNPLFVLKYFNEYFYWGSLGILPMLFLTVIPYLLDNPEKISRIDWLIIAVTFSLSILVLLKSLLLLWKPVYLGPKTPVWSRIKDNLLTYLVTTLIGAVLMFLAAKIGLINP